ncbi:helix-turn-helix transcriptional regulator [Haloarchaeobius sp. TZWWS8]|uniref:helix-turn-helix transcriptional regulator n=1 Tax=Haloarchaeobius sp. TZWWS8 TaxID=3446121 RepID=UPI003EB7B922
MRNLSVLVAALLLSTVAVSAGATVQGGAQPATQVGSTDVSAVAPFEPADPATVIEVNLTQSGDAEWSITYRYRLTGENETTAFRQYARDVEGGSADTRFSRSTFERFAAQASAWTGRKMEIRNAGWKKPSIGPVPASGTPTTTVASTTADVNTTASPTPAEPETKIGELTYTFTWTNFSKVEDDKIVVGDAFGTENETWFPRLYEGQRLVINEPPNYAITNSPANKGADDSSLVWDGPQTFDPGYIEATWVRVDSPPGTDPDEEPEQGFPFLIVGIGVLVVLVGTGSYLFARWQTEREFGEPKPTPNGGTTADDGDAPGATSSPTATVEAGEAETRVSEAAGAAADTTAAGAKAATADEDREDDSEPEEAEEAIDPELLSDEERVLRMLRKNGGRMKQANIVKETGWSNAKVSQLLSGMDEDGEIEKLRIGRENLITLPGETIGDFDNN